MEGVFVSQSSCADSFHEFPDLVPARRFLGFNLFIFGVLRMLLRFFGGVYVLIATDMNIVVVVVVVMVVIVVVIVVVPVCPLVLLPLGQRRRRAQGGRGQCPARALCWLSRFRLDQPPI